MDTLIASVERDLQLRSDLIESIQSEEQLLQLIAQFVQELIDADFEGLLRLLYRLDVSEIKVKKAIDNCGPSSATLAIAELILAREKEKVASREKFSSDNEEDWIF